MFFLIDFVQALKLDCEWFCREVCQFNEGFGMRFCRDVLVEVLLLFLLKCLEKLICL